MEDTRGEVYGASPTDRVEKLLQKYKSRQAVRSHEQLKLQPSRELEAWNLVNDKLQLLGYHPVSVARPTSSSLSKACVVLDETSSVTLRRTLLRLLEELKKKDGMVQDLLSALRSSKGYQPDFVTPPTRTNRPMKGLDAGHMTDPLVEKLQSQVTRLEYENTKLKTDLQNRPEIHELKKSQRRVRELEREVQQCKKLLSPEQVDLLHSHQQMKTVCSLLRVSDGQEVVPRITSLVGRVETADSLEKHLASVLNIVYHPSAPRVLLPVGDSPPAKPSGHDLWCEVTWGHVTLTLQEWLGHLRGLQELVLVFSEVCHQLPLPSSPSSEDEGDGLLQPELSLSCGEMATLIRQWLGKKGNIKNATTQALQAMVKHFQELFDAPRIEGVYPRMNQVYQKIEEARNIFKRIKTSLGLEPTCPNHTLISMVETLASSDNGQLLLQINRQFGIHEATIVMEKLQMCEEFFPTFQAIITEIQEFLGVDTLSAIIPALYNLQSGHSHTHSQSGHSHTHSQSGHMLANSDIM